MESGGPAQSLGTARPPPLPPSPQLSGTGAGAPRGGLLSSLKGEKMGKNWKTDRAGTGARQGRERRPEPRTNERRRKDR